MSKPVTPFVGCDVFVANAKDEVLLIQRSDNQFWALPGGTQDLSETPRECAERECFEESGYKVSVTHLLGVFSSQKYSYVNFPWKENHYAHLVFAAKVLEGTATTSSESLAVAWFAKDQLPPLSDGHDVRIKLGFEFLKNPMISAYFE